MGSHNAMEISMLPSFPIHVFVRETQITTKPTTHMTFVVNPAGDALAGITEPKDIKVPHLRIPCSSFLVRNWAWFAVVKEWPRISWGLSRFDWVNIQT